MTSPRFNPTIRTQSDLAEAWSTLMGPGGFSGRSVWMMAIVDGHPLPQLTEIAEADEAPRTQEMDGLSEVLRLLDGDLGPGVSFAFLLSRPGHGTVTEPDRAWAAALHHAATTARVACETVHLATGQGVRPLPLDELDAPARTA